MKKHLLFKILGLFFLVFASSCKNDDPSIPKENYNPTNLSLRFIEMENCPLSFVENPTVYENEIYYTGFGKLLKYSPSSNQWTSLNTLPYNTKTLFIYDDKLFCFSSSGLSIYNENSNSWNSASSIIPDPNNFVSSYDFVSNYKSIAGKLYAKCSTYTLEFVPSSRTWRNIGEKSFYDYDVCQIGNSGYWVSDNVFRQFNTDEKKVYNKLGPKQSYKYSMACNYGKNEMLCLNVEEMYYGIELTLGIYSPIQNKLMQYSYYNFETLHYPLVEIPAAFSNLATVDGRYFVGPTRGKYYEMKFINKK